MNMHNLLNGIVGQVRSYFSSGVSRVEKFFNKRQFEASRTDRHNSNWRGAGVSFNQELRFSLPRLRAISRDLAQNDPHVRKYIRTSIKYICGPEGFTVKNKAYDYFKSDQGKWEKVYDVIANNQIEEGFWNWSKKKYCTVTAEHSFRQFINTLIFNRKIDGEIFIKKIRVDNKLNPHGYTLQAIEASMVDENLNARLSNGNYIIMGIECDTLGRKIAFYFRKLKPTNDPVMQYYTNEYVRVPSEDVIHYYRKEWVGQLRGYPEVAPIANRIKTLKGYEEAALINARSSAMKTLILKYASQGLISTNHANIAGGEKQDDGTIEYNLEPGQIYVVPKGLEPHNYDPTYPTADIKPFTTSVKLTMASGLDMDYPTLTGDLSEINYTSIRHGMLDTRLGFKLEQADLREDVIEPVFEGWLEMAMLNGYLNLPMSKFEKFNNPKIIGYTGEWVDPLKDGRAKIEAMEAGLSTMEDTLAEMGRDLEEHLDQLAYEKKQREIRSLPLSIDITNWPEVKTEDDKSENKKGVKNADKQ